MMHHCIAKDLAWICAALAVPNLFLAGSYTFQDYIDSMEGATKSGLACAAAKRVTVACKPVDYGYGCLSLIQMRTSECTLLCAHLRG
jgi:hypothetical protein